MRQKGTSAPNEVYTNQCELFQKFAAMIVDMEGGLFFARPTAGLAAPMAEDFDETTLNL